jgi:hypothetical protein
MNSFLILYLIILVLFAIIWECITLGFYSAPATLPSAMWYVGGAVDFWTQSSGEQVSKHTQGSRRTGTHRNGVPVLFLTTGTDPIIGSRSRARHGRQRSGSFLFTTGSLLRRRIVRSKLVKLCAKQFQAIARKIREFL